jgi:hypothetical protein
LDLPPRRQKKKRKERKKKQKSRQLSRKLKEEEKRMLNDGADTGFGSSITTQNLSPDGRRLRTCCSTSTTT